MQMIIDRIIEDGNTDDLYPVNGFLASTLVRQFQIKLLLLINVWAKYN